MLTLSLHVPASEQRGKRWWIQDLLFQRKLHGNVPKECLVSCALCFFQTPFSTWLTLRQHLTGAAVTAARHVRSLAIFSCHQPDWAEVIWSRAQCHLGGWLVASYQVIRRKCPDSAAGWFIIKADVATDSRGRSEREGRARPFALTPLTDQRTVFAVQ